MANETLALSEILARLPAEADFDAACAALMATERGRLFLSEYTRRNRHADMQMVVSALERVEAAVRGDPAPELPSALPHIASDIERIESGLAGGDNVDDISAALERLHDVTFALHERLVEPSLRDAFDGAVRKLSDALTQPGGIVERRQRAIVQLRALAGRLREEVAWTSASDRPAPASEDDHPRVADLGAVPVSQLTQTDTPTTDTHLAYDQQSVVEEQSGVEDQAVVEDRAIVEDQVVAEAQAVVEDQAIVEDQPVVEQPETETAIAAGSIETVSAIANVTDLVDGAGSTPEASADVPPSSGSVLDEVFESDAFSRLTTLSENFSNPPPPPQEIEIASNGEPAGELLLPSQAYSQEIIASPEQDPGDLFEPMPMPSPVGAASVGEEPASEPDISPQRANMTEATRSVPRTAASDPLTAVRNLSEEELIALFT
jgi:hypothetical protein